MNRRKKLLTLMWGGSTSTSTPPTYLLDTYTGAAAAYSLRKLRTGATLAVKIRRDSDDATTDVLLDDTGSITLSSVVSAGGTLGAWAGSSSVFIDTWYDQSGNGLDAVNDFGNVSLMAAGSLITGTDGNVGIKFDASTLKTTGYAVELSANNASVFSVIEADVGRGYIFSESDDQSPYSSQFILGGPNGDNALWLNTTLIGSTIVNGDSSTLGFDYNGTNIQAYQNGLVDGSPTSGTINTESGNGSAIGGGLNYTTNHYDGLIYELITYKSNQSSNRKDIETNINDYYSVYPTYLLDTYTGAAAAYSLRKLRTGETYACTIRRVSDNATTDILLEDSGSISLSSTVSAGGTLGAWVGSGAASITKWYDQSGSGNHATAEISRASLLIENGTLVESNGKAAIQGSIGKGLSIPRLFTDNTWSIHGVTEPTDLSPSSSSALLSQHPGASVVGRTYLAYVTASNSKTKLFFNNGTSYVGTASMDWALKQTSFSNYAASNDYSWSQDGSAPETLISGQAFTPADEPTVIGNLGNFASQYEGTFQEFIIYKTDQSSNRSAIEADINNFYSIY